MEYDDVLIEDYKDMAKKLCWTFTNNPVLWQDLMQEAYIGLGKACEGYDPERGTMFSTYAWDKMRGQVLQYLNYNNDMIHVPTTVENKMVMVNIEESYSIGEPPPKRTGLKEALKKLKPSMANILTMHYIEGYTKVEIAESSGVKYQTLVSRMRRGLKQLRKIMDVGAI